MGMLLVRKTRTSFNDCEKMWANVEKILVAVAFSVNGWIEYGLGDFDESQ